MMCVRGWVELSVNQLRLGKALSTRLSILVYPDTKNQPGISNELDGHNGSNGPPLFDICSG